MQLILHYRGYGENLGIFFKEVNPSVHCKFLVLYFGGLLVSNNLVVEAKKAKYEKWNNYIVFFSIDAPLPLIFLKHFKLAWKCFWTNSEAYLGPCQTSMVDFMFKYLMMVLKEWVRIQHFKETYKFFILGGRGGGGGGGGGGVKNKV